MADENDTSQDAKRSTSAEVARASTVLAAALVTAVFAALGIQGDLLVRTVRGHPQQTFGVFVLVIVSLAVAAFLTRSSNQELRILRILASVGPPAAALLVVAGTIWAVVLATESIEDRERPAIQIVPHWADARDGQVPITVAATGTSLRSDESMLLRVVALRSDSVGAVQANCVSSSSSWYAGKATPAFHGPGYVLSWGISGPDVNGKVSSTTDVLVDISNMQYVCAYAGLLNRPKASAPSYSYSIVDVTSAHPFPTSTPAPTNK